MRKPERKKESSSYENLSTLSKITRIFRIFPTRDRRKIILVASIQVVLTLLDLVGVALIGIIGSLSVTGIQSKSASGRIYEILELLGIEKFSFQIQIAILGSLSILLFISKTLMSVLLIKRTLYFMARKSAEISAKLTEKLLSQNLQEIKMKSSQDMLFAINAGVNAISLGIVGTLVMLTSDLVLFIIMSISLFIVSFSMAVTSLLIFGGVSTFLYLRMRNRAQQIGLDSMVKSIRVNELVSEVIHTYREAIVRNRRDWYQKRINDGKFEVARLNAELSFLPNISKYVIESVMMLSLLIVASVQFLTGTASTAIGVTAIFLAATSRIAPAALRLQQGAIQVKNNLSYAAPALEVLALDQFSPTLEGKKEVNRIDFTNAGSISVNQVSFAYSKSSKLKTISDVSFEIPFGSSFALVGPSGSGKSTLVDLILGLMDPDSGRIEIGGLKPNVLIESSPGLIGYVPQNTHLIEGTIKENIALGFDPDEFDVDEFEKAIEIAQLSDYVKRLPDGLETKVGENGARISGGQRQRIGIARAMITSPKILVLDEATSSLDSTTEYELVQSIENLKNQVTVIVIAHRLSTIKKMDQIAYLEMGKVKAIGSFKYVKRKVPNFGVQAKLMGL